MNKLITDDITTTKQLTTKPGAYFTGCIFYIYSVITITPTTADCIPSLFSGSFWQISIMHWDMPTKYKIIDHFLFRTQ